VKKLHLSWSAVAILAPLAIVCAILVGSIHGTDTALAGKKKGSLQVAFITVVTGPNGQAADHYQNVFLNVSSVRINRKPKPNAKNTAVPPEGAGSWITIPVPVGVGGVTHGNPGDLQVDAIAGQSEAQYYNTGSVNQNTYYTFEVSFDTNNPGFVVPNCPSGGPREGCINYPIIFQNPGAQVAYVSSQGISVNKGQLTLLMIQINVSIVSVPSGPGQPYTVNVKVAPADSGSFMGTITGTVSNASTALNKKKVRKLTVSAEAPGTGNVIASAPVQSNGNYLINLPAVPDGTLYDLYASGGGGSYEAARLPIVGAPGPLIAGQTINLDFNNVTTGHTLGSIGGTITDNCTSQPISGATLQLLIPPDGNLSLDCSDPTLVSQCVTVATTSTDNVGDFPLPGTVLQPASFQQIPLLGNNASYTYTLEVSASGYDTLLVKGVTPTSGKSKVGGDCGSASSSKVGCDLSLTTGYINGTVTLAATPQNNENILLQVFAEISGTSNLVAALPTPVLIRGPNQSRTFTLNVPTSASLGSGTNLDLFAYAIDLYQGANDPYTGHSIITTQAPLPVPSACATSTATPFAEQMECTGHGSIAGFTINPNTGTTVALSKNGVILETAPGGVPQPAPTVSQSNVYSFCAPPDTYSVQRYQQEGNPPTPVPIGTATAVGPMAAPQATSTPCPSTCFSSSGTCPGICGATIGPAL
jgi:hypothetical protein